MCSLLLNFLTNISQIMDNYTTSSYASTYDRGVSAETSLIRDVYVWMSAALVITGLVAYYVANDYNILSIIFGNQMVFWGLCIAELAIVLGLSAAINKISAFTATIMFIVYSVLNGATLSSIFLLYEMGSIASTFFVTAGTFGAMAIYGSVTKTDLTKIGNICFMALIGIIIASLVNIFLVKSGMMELIINIAGVVIFVGLTAYDSQKIKALLYNAESMEVGQKIAVLGALTLYLDFINLFLKLLALFGKKK